MLPLVVKGEALSSALPLIVTAALSDGVNIAPVPLRLRVLQGITIHLSPTTHHIMTEAHLLPQAGFTQKCLTKGHRLDNTGSHSVSKYADG